MNSCDAKCLISCPTANRFGAVSRLASLTAVQLKIFEVNQAALRLRGARIAGDSPATPAQGKAFPEYITNHWQGLILQETHSDEYDQGDVLP